MDITQAAFGLDMRSASRIYFINPVLNPQVEAQAIGRTRRISQQKPVTVETLVLRGSVEEVIVCRRKEMTQAEQWRCKSILDDKPIYEWILNVKILEMPGLREGESESRSEEQMAWLERPLLLFRKGFGRGVEHPDQDLVALKNGSPTRERKGGVNGDEMRRKRNLAYQEDGMHGMSLRLSSTSGTSGPATAEDSGLGPRKKRRVRFAMDDD
jgi:Superfamily II DNA/RNA helicases, SNF2 family